MTTDPTKRRVAILHHAAQLTGANRNIMYGEPVVNLTLAGQLKQVFREGLTRSGVPMSLGEVEAWDQVLTKLSRAATGGFNEDTYTDAAAYAAIAGEIAELDRGFTNTARVPTEPLQSGFQAVQDALEPDSPREDIPPFLTGRGALAQEGE